MSLHILRLFQRGRYVSLRSLAAQETGGDSKNRQEQRERFCVAAIGLALEYDTDFKALFLRAVAGLKPNEIYSIRPEPNLWGDLVLEGSKDAIVIEFKIGALVVQQHQDPTEPIFSEIGYGAKISKTYAKEGKRARYVVVGGFGFDPCNPGGLPCSAVGWKELLPPPSFTESDLVRDLYDSLGHLGIPMFLTRSMKPTYHGEAISGMQVYAALEGILERAKLPSGGPDSGDGCIGLTVTKTGAAKNRSTLHARLVQQVSPSKKALAWVGFEQMSDVRDVALSVWFYCSSRTAPRVLKHLRAHNYPVAERDGNSVVVRCSACESLDDVDWFLRVLGAFEPAAAKSKKGTSLRRRSS